MLSLKDQIRFLDAIDVKRLERGEDNNEHQIPFNDDTYKSGSILEFQIVESALRSIEIATNKLAKKC